MFLDFFNLTQWAAWVLNLSEIHSKLHTIVPRALGLEKGNVAEVLQVEVGEETQEKKAEDSFFFSTFFSIHSVLGAVLPTGKNSTSSVSAIKEGSWLYPLAH